MSAIAEVLVLERSIRCRILYLNWHWNEETLKVYFLLLLLLLFLYSYFSNFSLSSSIKHTLFHIAIHFTAKCALIFYKVYAVCTRCHDINFIQKNIDSAHVSTRQICGKMEISRIHSINKSERFDSTAHTHTHDPEF